MCASPPGERRREVSREDRFPARSRSTTSWPSQTRAQGDEELVQLPERLAHHIRRPGAGSVESFLRWIEVVHDQQRLATFFLEGDRGDRPALATFLIGPR